MPVTTTLIPFAVVAWLRAPVGSPAGSRARALLVAAGVVAAIAIAWLPLLYVAVGLVLGAVRLSRGEATAARPAPAVVGA